MGEPNRALSLRPVIGAKSRLFEDGIRRVLDLDLAEWNELAQPRNIRQVIEANREDLERHGPLHVARAMADRPQGGGRSATEYWLTFKQAIRLCTYLRTPRSEDVRTALIDVFEDVAMGGISTMPRMDLRALEIFAQTTADRIVAPILADQRKFHGEILVKLDRHDDRLCDLNNRMLGVEKKLSEEDDRCSFTKHTRNLYRSTVLHHCGSRCPCCHETIVLDEHGCLIPGIAEFDHWFHKSKRQVDAGWLVCGKCNSRLNDVVFKNSHYADFNAFQNALNVERRAMTSQGTLDLQ